jgi:DNA-binding MarR family transcriptional regulator
MTEENVNLDTKKKPKLTFHRSQQMLGILRFLYNDNTHVFKQSEIIRALYGETAPSRKASFSRTVKTLIKLGLVESRKAYYSNQFNCWISQRVCFYITAKGEQFVREAVSQ